MTLYEILGSAVGWVESHEHTVDLMKWVAAGVAAWMLGVFRAIREWARRPSISVNPMYSQCYVEKHLALGEHNDVALLVFVVDAEILNPTGSRLGVRRFELRAKRMGWLRRWTKPVAAIGFPSMPRTPMPGDAVKVVPIWMTTFEGCDQSLTLTKIEAQDSAAGLVFFAVALPSAMLNKAMTECQVKLCVTFGTGEERSVNAAIKVRTDLDHLDRIIPGSLPYVRHQSVWTHCA